jgi:uncharacterized protein (TIGR00255 family)
MIKSMTGFAAASQESPLATVSVTIKAVNHRFLDLQLRVPVVLGPAEPAIRARVQQQVARGRVDVALTIQTRAVVTQAVQLDEAFALGVAGAMNRARELGVVTGALTPGDLLKFSQAVVIREEPVSAGNSGAAVLELALQTLGGALEELDAMRRTEGEFLRKDLDQRRDRLAALIGRAADAAREGDEALRTRLDEKIAEIGGVQGVEPAAIALEVVRFVARSDISEEVVRFRAHLAHGAELTASGEPCGRKLDFLLQEMNREVNTIGAKAEGWQVSPLIVEIKAELERMREQVQNVE